MYCRPLLFNEAKFCPEFSRFFHCLKVNKSFPVVRFNKHRAIFYLQGAFWKRFVLTPTLTPTQTHLPFPPRLLPLPSDFQPRPSPSFRLTCRKREVLLVGSQWNSTVLSCEGSTWGSITPTDSGTSAGTGWQAGSRPQPSPTTRPSKPKSGLEGSLLPLHSPMSRMRSPGRLHLHPSSCCCSVYCRRRSWKTTRTTLWGHSKARLTGQRVPGHLGTSS